jgi:hypothetical protein
MYLLRLHECLYNRGIGDFVISRIYQQHGHINLVEAVLDCPRFEDIEPGPSAQTRYYPIDSPHDIHHCRITPWLFVYNIVSRIYQQLCDRSEPKYYIIDSAFRTDDRFYYRGTGTATEAALGYEWNERNLQNFIASDETASLSEGIPAPTKVMIANDQYSSIPRWLQVGFEHFPNNPQ